jgi:DNA-binding transcriptional LysR family regulator
VALARRSPSRRPGRRPAQRTLAELVQHGLGISVLPPNSVRSVTAQVSTIPITPPLRRDIAAVTAATRPPEARKPLLDILQADIKSAPPAATEKWLP